MNKFLNQLNEQDPPALPPVKAGGEEGEDQRFLQARPVTGTTRTIGPERPTTPKEPMTTDIREPQAPTDIRFISTPDLFTTVPPSDAADWPTENKRKTRYYWPLRNGNVGAALVKALQPTGFMSRGRSTAARYSEYQFRIIMRGDFYFDSTVEAHIKPDNTVDVNIAKISTSTPNSKTPIVFEGGDDRLGGKEIKNIKIKMKTSDLLDWAGAKKQTDAEEDEDEGEPTPERLKLPSPSKLMLPAPASGVDADDAESISSDFFDNLGEASLLDINKYLLEVEIERTAQEKKIDYERYLKPAFTRYVRNYLLTQGSSEAVKKALKDNKKKKEIMKEFAQVYMDWAGITDADDGRRKALEDFIGEKIPIKTGPPPKKSSIKIEPKEDDNSATIKSESEVRKFIRNSIDDEDKEKLALKVYKNIAAGLPEDHPFITKTTNINKIIQSVEDVDTEEEAVRKAFHMLRKKDESVNLSTYLRSLILEQEESKKKAFPKPPRRGATLEKQYGGELISRLNDKIFSQWFGRGKIAASNKQRFLEGALYEFLVVSEATFRPRKRTVQSVDDDGSIVVEFEGELVTEAEIWIDARLGEKGTLSTWTFRVHDEPNKPFLTKGFGLVGKASATISRNITKQKEDTSKPGGA